MNTQVQINLPNLNEYKQEFQKQGVITPLPVVPFCNQFWQHKKHIVVFQALHLLHKQSIYPNIVFTGNLYDSRQPSYINTVLQSIHKLRIAK
jgi:hypothetical protein